MHKVESDIRLDDIYVEFRKGIRASEPTIPRYYVLSNNAEGKPFLTIGRKYASDRFTSSRNEILCKWRFLNRKYVFYVYVHVDGKGGLAISEERNKDFIEKLPRALRTIIYEEKIFFRVHGELDNAPVFVCFNSKHSHLRRIEYWGTIKDYKCLSYL